MNQTHAASSVTDIAHRIEAVRAQLDPHQFTSGRCHDFAVALQSIVGGDLYVILRHEVDEDGRRFSTTYSHTILCVDGEDYDIWGSGAGERWEEQWDEGQNKWDMSNEFEYLEMALATLPSFLDDHHAALDVTAISAVITALASTSQQAA